MKILVSQRPRRHPQAKRHWLLTTDASGAPAACGLRLSWPGGASVIGRWMPPEEVGCRGCQLALAVSFLAPGKPCERCNGGGTVGGPVFVDTCPWCEGAGVERAFMWVA